jgi:transcriptional antiterminator RfaH
MDAADTDAQLSRQIAIAERGICLKFPQHTKAQIFPKLGVAAHQKLKALSPLLPHGAAFSSATVSEHSRRSRRRTLPFTGEHGREMLVWLQAGTQRKGHPMRGKCATLTVSPDEHVWRLAQLRPNCLALARRNLARQGFGTFVPVLRKTRPIKGRFVTALEPLFPGYIFVDCGLTGADSHLIGNTRGVSALVQFGGAAAKVPSEMVDLLRQRCDQDHRLEDHAMLTPGHQFTMDVGPFTEFLAEVERSDEKSRAWVLIELLGRKTRVELPKLRLVARAA